MSELRHRGVIWSGKSPLADYAEYLVARHYGVEPIRGQMRFITAVHEPANARLRGVLLPESLLLAPVARSPLTGNE
jgi:hypothetical protein